MLASMIFPPVIVETLAEAWVLLQAATLVYALEYDGWKIESRGW